jgi:hypothetical protein
MKNYDKELKTATEFRDFFKEIPPEQWTTQAFSRGDDECRCALGLVGRIDPETKKFSHTENSERLCKMAYVVDQQIPVINDGEHWGYGSYPHPKDRILVFLEFAIKKGL